MPLESGLAGAVAAGIEATGLGLGGAAAMGSSWLAGVATTVLLADIATGLRTGDVADMGSGLAWAAAAGNTATGLGAGDAAATDGALLRDNPQVGSRFHWMARVERTITGLGFAGSGVGGASAGKCWLHTIFLPLGTLT